MRWYNEQMKTPLFSTDLYSFTIEDVPGGVNIVLNSLAAGTSKVFFLAGERSHQRLAEHMNSLTDTLIEQWFVKREHKPKKEKAAGEKHVPPPRPPSQKAEKRLKKLAADFDGDTK